MRRPGRHWSCGRDVIFPFLVILVLAAGIAPQAGWAEPFSARATLLRNREFADALIQGIRSARSSVHLCYFIFKTTDARGNFPRRIVEELIRARQRGVDVTVLLEMERKGSRDSLNSDNRHTAELLTRGGIRVFFDPPDVTTHAKVAVIDGRFVYLGSHNLSQSALQHNNELSVKLDSPEMATEVQEYLDRL